MDYRLWCYRENPFQQEYERGIFPFYVHTLKEKTSCLDSVYVDTGLGLCGEPVPTALILYEDGHVTSDVTRYERAQTGFWKKSVIEKYR